MDDRKEKKNSRQNCFGASTFSAFSKGQKSTSKFWKTPETKKMRNTFICSKLMLFFNKIKVNMVRNLYSLLLDVSPSFSFCSPSYLFCPGGRIKLCWGGQIFFKRMGGGKIINPEHASVIKVAIVKSVEYPFWQIIWYILSNYINIKTYFWLKSTSTFDNLAMSCVWCIMSFCSTSNFHHQTISEKNLIFSWL